MGAAGAVEFEYPGSARREHARRRALPAARVRPPRASSLATADSRLLTALRSHAIFTGLSPAQIERLVANSDTMQVVERQVLYERGEAAGHFYLVIEGQVNLALYSNGGDEKSSTSSGPARYSPRQ
jgi:hypothetical protein